MRFVRIIGPVITGIALLAAGCGTSDTESSTANAVEIQAEALESRSSTVVLDMRTTVPDASGEVAGASVATNPPLTSSSIGTSVPPPTLTGAEATTPTTRPPATQAPTVAPSTATTIATSTTSTTVTSTAQAPAPTAPTTRPAPVDSSGGTRAPAGVVEFRIPAGTQAGAWNSFDDPVRVSVGQTLRIYNDDVVAHTLHSTGVPFAHGPTIQPGTYADHPIIEPYTPDRASPANYEHDAGPSAPFWVVATATDQGSAGAAGPAELVAAEAESLRLLNGLRSDLGVQQVFPIDPEMHAFAREWSLEMRTTGFRHSSPPKWFENIVWYSDETMTPAEAAAQFHDMWINSPGHYQNMTNPDWSVVGIGMWHDETGWWGVHVFR